MNSTDAERQVRAAVATLSEHFDAVQILVTWPNSTGGTAAFALGAGNWYARQGLAREFIAKDQADTLARAIPLPPSGE